MGHDLSRSALVVPGANLHGNLLIMLPDTISEPRAYTGTFKLA